MVRSTISASEDGSAIRWRLADDAVSGSLAGGAAGAAEAAAAAAGIVLIAPIEGLALDDEDDDD